jgi:C-terminal processing protease CtpA/Prc
MQSAEEPTRGGSDQTPHMAAPGLDSKDYQLREEEADRLVALLEAFGHDKIYIWAYDRKQVTTSITASPSDHQLMASLIQLLGNERRALTNQANQKGEDIVWQRLGLSLDPIEADQLRRYQTPLRGGLIVLRVRKESPAAQMKVAEGDVIIGLGDWETVSVANVEWVLDHAEQIKDGEPIRILTLRDGQLREAAAHLGPQ